MSQAFARRHNRLEDTVQVGGEHVRLEKERRFCYNLQFASDLTLIMRGWTKISRPSRDRKRRTPLIVSQSNDQKNR